DHREEKDDLDVADDADAARDGFIGPPRVAFASQESAPADEREHRPDLEQKDHAEDPHLVEKELVVRVVRSRLFGAGEKSPETRDDPEQRGDAPPRIGRERAAHAAHLEGTLRETARASPDAA